MHLYSFSVIWQYCSYLNPFSYPLFIFRPLTEAEIALRRQKAKERLAEKAASRAQGKRTEATTPLEETTEGSPRL